MKNSQETRRIERKAKALMLNKSIPKGKMAAVRSLINDHYINDRERYSTIIDLIKECPDKIIKVPEKKTPVTPVIREKAVTDQTSHKNKKPPVDFSPTDTSYYIDNLKQKYNSLRLFKKRYLVHRNNRFGIGFRKRLIPSSKLLKIIKFISEYQEKITEVLSPLHLEILNDVRIEDPLNFNYLRIMKRWLKINPLVKYNYDTIKWLERNTFESELRNFIYHYFSFLKLDPKTRENLITVFNEKIREIPDLRKEELSESDSDQVKRGKDIRNHEKEKKIHEYLTILRSFIPSGLKDETLLSKKLKKQYGIPNLSELIIIVSEALIFQRPITLDEISMYFHIKEPSVSHDKWDYKEEYLRKINKDPVSIKRKKVEKLKQRLEPYEDLVSFLKAEKNEKSHVYLGVKKQWELIDKNKQNPETSYHEDFISFLEGALHFFKNTYLQILDGSIIYLRDPKRNEIKAPLFTERCFEDEIFTIRTILEEIHILRINNPTMTLKNSEINRIMKKQFKSLGNVEDLIRKTGNAFYKMGKKVQEIYDLHKKWIFNGSPLINTNKKRMTLDLYSINLPERRNGIPMPFYDCTIKELIITNELAELFQGRKLLEENRDKGIYYDMIAFLFQMASECSNEYLFVELDERKRLIRLIDDTSI